MPRPTEWVEIWLVDPVARFDGEIIEALAELRISVRVIRTFEDLSRWYKHAPSPWGVIYAGSLDRPLVAYVAGVLTLSGPRSFSWRLPKVPDWYAGRKIERLPARAKPREIAALISFRVRHLVRARARRAAAPSLPAGG